MECQITKLVLSNHGDHNLSWWLLLDLCSRSNWRSESAVPSCDRMLLSRRRRKKIAESDWSAAVDQSALLKYEYLKCIMSYDHMRVEATHRSMDVVTYWMDKDAAESWMQLTSLFSWWVGKAHSRQSLLHRLDLRLNPSRMRFRVKFRWNDEQLLRVLDRSERPEMKECDAARKVAKNVFCHWVRSFRS